jgi:hypothetical protein
MMKIRPYIFIAAFYALAMIYLVLLWRWLHSVLLTPSVHVMITPTFLVFCILLSAVAYGTVIQHPIACIIPFIALVIGMTTFLSFDNMRFGSSLSWSGFTFGWPLTWLTVSRYSTIDWSTAENGRILSFGWSVKLLPLLGNMAIFGVVSAGSIAGWICVMKVKKRKANNAPETYCRKSDTTP